VDGKTPALDTAANIKETSAEIRAEEAEVSHDEVSPKAGRSFYILT
jgi:hypothetical protein